MNASKGFTPVVNIREYRAGVTRFLYRHVMPRGLRKSSMSLGSLISILRHVWKDASERKTRIKGFSERLREVRVELGILEQVDEEEKVILEEGKVVDWDVELFAVAAGLLGVEMWYRGLARVDSLVVVGFFESVILSIVVDVAES